MAEPLRHGPDGRRNAVVLFLVIVVAGTAGLAGSLDLLLDGLAIATGADLAELRGRELEVLHLLPEVVHVLPDFGLGMRVALVGTLREPAHLVESRERGEVLAPGGHARVIPGDLALQRLLHRTEIVSDQGHHRLAVGDRRILVLVAEHGDRGRREQYARRGSPQKDSVVHCFPPMGSSQVGVHVVPDPASIPRNGAMVINAAIGAPRPAAAAVHCDAPGCSLPALPSRDRHLLRPETAARQGERRRPIKDNS